MKDRASNEGCGFNALAICEKVVKYNIRPNHIKKNAAINSGKSIADKCNLKYEDPVSVDKFSIIERTLDCRIFVFENDQQGRMHVVYKPRENDRSKPLYTIGFDAAKTHYYYPLIKDKIKVTIGSINPNLIKREIFCHQCYSFTTNMALHLEHECEYYKCKQCLLYECRDGKVILSS